MKRKSKGSEIRMGFLLQVKAHGWYMSRDTWRVRFTGEMGLEKLPKNKYYFFEHLLYDRSHVRYLVCVCFL